MSSGPLNNIIEGLHLLHIGDLPGAQSSFEAALRENPKDGEAMGFLGIVRARNGDMAGSMLALKDAVRLQPGDIGALYNLGIAQKQANQTEEARKTFQEALELDPNDSAVLTAISTLEAETAAPPRDIAAGLPGVLLNSAPLYGTAQPAPAPQPGMVFQPAAMRVSPPSITQRVGRGAAWGLFYGQWWTLWSIASLFLWNIGGVNANILQIGIIYFIGYGAAGCILGLIIGGSGVQPNKASMMGVAFGLLILGLEALHFRSATQLINIFFYFITGRYIGAKIAWRVHQPVH